MNKQIITIEFTLMDEEQPFERIPAEERAQYIAEFVADELVEAGTCVSYDIKEALDE